MLLPVGILCVKSSIFGYCLFKIGGFLHCLVHRKKKRERNKRRLVRSKMRTPRRKRPWLTWLNNMVASKGSVTVQAYYFFFLNLIILRNPIKNNVLRLFWFCSKMEGREQRSKRRGKRRERSWQSGGNRSTLTIWTRTSWSESEAGHRFINQKPSVVWVCSRFWFSAADFSALLLKGRRPVSSGSGWWCWKRRNSTTPRSSRDRNMTWVLTRQPKVNNTLCLSLSVNNQCLLS